MQLTVPDGGRSNNVIEAPCCCGRRQLTAASRQLTLSMALLRAGLLSLLLVSCAAFDHSRTAPHRHLLHDKDHRYKLNDEVPLWASKVGPFANPRCATHKRRATAPMQQDPTHNPPAAVPCSETYEYYKLPYCKPEDGVRYKTLGMGEVRPPFHCASATAPTAADCV